MTGWATCGILAAWTNCFTAIALGTRSWAESKAYRTNYNPRVSDRKALMSMEAFWDQEAIAGVLLKRITKRTTAQGITYRAYF